MVFESILASGGPLLITFRESLEAALIVAIVLAYLNKTGHFKLKKYVYGGAFAAIILSLGIGYLLFVVYGGLQGFSAKLFEGVAGILAAIVLTYMIFWMGKHAKTIKEHLQQKVDKAVSTGFVLGIALLSFVAVFREGIETVLFLTATAVQDVVATLFGAAVGVILVLVIAAFTMNRIYSIDLKKFFKYSSIILLIFAAGLFGYGIHEFIEAAEISGVDVGFWGEKPYNINPPVNPDGSYPILHEKGTVGSILKGLIGYDGDPEWLRIIGYLLYWLFVGLYILKIYYPEHRVSRMLTGMGRYRKLEKPEIKNRKK